MPEKIRFGDFIREASIQQDEISYNELIADPRKVSEQICAFVEHDLSVDQMIHEVDPDLYRSRSE